MIQTVTEFIIDLSASMKDKMALTKRMLIQDIIPNLDYSSRIGIKSFSGVTGQPPVIQELPLNIIDIQSIRQTISRLQYKNGGTPISEAIRQSIITLKEYSVNDKKIILVTDGEEDSGGDYLAGCKKARSEGINCEIHIIGVGLNHRAQTKAREISKLTNGTFSNIPFTQGTEYNHINIKNNLSTFYNAVNNNKIIAPIQTKASMPLKSAPTISHEPTKVDKEILKSDSIVQVEDNIKKIETETEVTLNDENKRNKLENTNLILESLVKEIKEIRDDIKKLKSDTNAIPEIVENLELNERIRLISEKYLFELLKVKYPNRVKWLNENGETGSNHDFEILEEDGSVEYYIECKGTTKNKMTFYVTKNEWNLFLNNTKNYQIYFIQNTLENPTHIFINNLLDWLLKGKIFPYLKSRDIIKEERVFLTISDSNFII